MDPERLLGELLRAGLRSGRHAGRHARGFGRGLGGGIGRTIVSGRGLTILGGIAIAAFEHLQQKGVIGGAKGGGAAMGQPMEPPPVPPTPPSPAELHAQAMILIEAMVNAAKADGAIDDEERARLMAELDKAGATPEERSWLEAEMAKPSDVESLLAKVKSPDLAAQVYAASVLVTGNDEPGERAYLGLLAARLGLSGEMIDAINRQVEQAPGDAS